MHDVRTYIYIYIYKKHIYIYDEDFSQLYDKCGARAARQLYIFIYIFQAVRRARAVNALRANVGPAAPVEVQRSI